MLYRYHTDTAGDAAGLREAVTRQGGMAELAALLRRAERENKWVIHYGI